MDALPSDAGVVVDVGAGNGEIAARLARRVSHVIAIDRTEPLVRPAEIDWVTGSVEEWVRTLPADFRASGYLLRNVVQFVDKSWVLSELLPLLEKHLEDRGVIGIETFTKAPIPPFSTEHPAYYSSEDFTEALRHFEPILAAEVVTNGLDRQGIPRTFFLTRIIAKMRPVS